MSNRSTVGRILRSYTFYVVLGVVLGGVVAPIAYTASSAPDGTVAVVPLEGTINGQSAAGVSAMLSKARQDPDIKAVVIVSNSGGGGAAASEELYLQSKRTADQMPVVASVDAAAASGAYYTIAPSDYIYVKPSSVVGSVGVLAPTPTQVEPNNVVGTTGPNKLSGYDRREFFYLLESLRRAFISAVYQHRGDELRLSQAQLSQARIYAGTQAVQNGLADDIGGRQAAIRHAARLAGLDDYRVKTLRPDGTARFVSRNNYLASDAPNKTMVSPHYVIGNETTTPVFLMMPGSYVRSAEDVTFVTGAAAAAASNTSQNQTGTPGGQPATALAAPAREVT